MSQWDKLSEKKDPETGYASIDALHWFNYLAFDIIGDLAFGAPFGMVEKGKDVAEVRKTPDAQPTYSPAIEVLNRRGEVSTTLGCMPVSTLCGVRESADKTLESGSNHMPNIFQTLSFATALPLSRIWLVSQSLGYRNDLRIRRLNASTSLPG